VLACQPAVISHWTAGWVWGIFKTSSTLHLTTPTERRPRRPFYFHRASLRAADVTEIDGIPVTSLARTLLDLAALVAPERLAKLLQRANELEDDEGRGLFDLREVTELLARSKGHPGRRPLTRALRIYRDDLVVLRSDFERDFRALVQRAGLPAPAANVNVAGYEIDCWWEDARFGVELDVYATHGSPLSFEEDRIRIDDLMAIGVEVTRVTDVRLEREADKVMQRLAGHLARRRRPATSNAMPRG
jgi:very-short-patch-repair endonuclease